MAGPHGRRATRASARASCPRASSTPSSASASTSSSWRRTAASTCTSRTTAACTGRRRRRAVGGDHRPACRRSSASRWAPTRATRRPSGRSRSPSPRRAASCSTAMPPSGGRTTAATTWIRSDDGLPQHDAYVGVLREAMAVDPLDPVGVYFGTSTGQLYGSRDEGAQLAPHRRQPAGDLVRRGRRRRRLTGGLSGRWRRCILRARWSRSSRAGPSRGGRRGNRGERHRRARRSCAGVARPSRRRRAAPAAAHQRLRGGPAGPARQPGRGGRHGTRHPGRVGRRRAAPRDTHQCISVARRVAAGMRNPVAVVPPSSIVVRNLMALPPRRAPPNGSRRA